MTAGTAPSDHAQRQAIAVKAIGRAAEQYGRAGNRQEQQAALWPLFLWFDCLQAALGAARRESRLRAIRAEAQERKVGDLMNELAADGEALLKDKGV